MAGDLEEFIKEEAWKKAASFSSLPILRPKDYSRSKFLEEITPAVSFITSNLEEAKRALNIIFEAVSYDTRWEGDGFHSHSSWWEENVGVYLEGAIALIKSPKKFYELLYEKISASPETQEKIIKAYFTQLEAEKESQKSD